MRYKFQNFEFNSSSLVLTQSGEPISIRHNEAKVLLLLIENPDKVFSKEDILSEVWQDKVVSEQAVFQNVSHLRNILGTDAIKTFPKRGYQWQLDVTIIDETLVSLADSSCEQDTRPLDQESKLANFRLLPAILLAALMIFVAIVYWPDTSSEEAEKLAQVGYIPFTYYEGESQSTLQLEDTQLIDFSLLESLSTAEFEAAEELKYRAVSSQYPLVLIGKVRNFQQSYYLDFSLKGPVSKWQGQLVANSLENLFVQLQAHLSQAFIYQLISEPHSPEIKQASLSLAHQQSPNDLIILGQLIDSYIVLGEYEKAMTLADKLLNNAQQQNNIQQAGIALLYQSKVLTQKQLFELSEVKLITAREKFAQVNDLARQADAFHAHSWISHQFNDYSAIRVNLLKAAELAFEISDIERELHALTYLSVLAHKHRKIEDQYHFLTQAENKMNEYELPIYRFAKIPFHHAIYTASLDGKEPHLKRVLEYTKLTPDHWVAQSSRKQLMQYYIAKERFEDARKLLEQAVSINAHNAYLRALFARVNQQEEAFISYAKEAFEQAQLAGERSISLDAALMLCSSPNTQINYDFYSQFIRENATDYWRRANREGLAALNLML